MSVLRLREWRAKRGLSLRQLGELASVSFVTLYRIETWIAPTEPGAFTKVWTYQCHHEDGAHFQRDLTSFVKPEDVITHD